MVRCRRKLLETIENGPDVKVDDQIVYDDGQEGEGNRNTGEEDGNTLTGAISRLIATLRPIIDPTTKSNI